MFINKICNAFDNAQIKYALVGGHAVALHGAVRGTVDLDFILKWNKKNLLKVEKVLLELGFKSKLPITAEDVFYFKDEYINNRNLIAWNFYNPSNPVEQIDIIIKYDLAKYRTKTVKTDNGPIKVITIDDLITIKKESGRPQDIEDIKALEQLK